jgi:hypothetical protein
VPGRAIDSRSAHQLDEPSRLGGYHDAGSGCCFRANSQSSDMASCVRLGGSLAFTGGSSPFIWWPCWPTTGAYAAARVASSASTRCRWKAACHILLPRRHGPAGWSGSDAARDAPPSPGNLRPSRSGEPSGIDLPPKPRSGPVLRLSETVGKSSLRATLERRALRAVLAGIRRVWAIG